MRSSRLKFKTVSSYLAAVPKEQRDVLQRMRRTIKAAAPRAEEVISYGIPGYKHCGMLVFFAAFRDHCSFFPASKLILKNFAKELQPFKVKGSTIHFTPQNPLPAALLKKMVKARVAQNEARRK